MSVSPEETFEQFKSISGVTGSDDDDKVRLLLTNHQYNLNNALSIYFDSGFDSLNQTSVTTGADFHEDDTELNRRRHHEPTPDNSLSAEFTNLQSQMFMQDLIPKLPKANKILNKWQLELGIYASMNEKAVLPEPRKINLWIILLIIPKTLLQLLVSVFRFFFTSPTSVTNNFPRHYDYSDYQKDYKFQQWWENDDDETVCGSVIEKTEKESVSEGGSIEKPHSVGSDLDNETKVDETSIFDIYNIQDSQFNQCHERAQKEYVWLIVILINDSPENSAWLKSLLSNKIFQTNFNKNDGTYKENIIYINNIKKSPESWEVGKEYHTRKLPFLMVIGNISNNPAILSSMSIIYKSNLILGDDYTNINRKINRNLNKVFDLYNPQLITSRFDQQEIQMSRIMVQQQNDAYEQSLNQDREKKLVKQQLKQQMEQEKMDQLIKQKFIETTISGDYINTIKGNTKMAIKLPSGVRIIENFNDSITLQQLYLFIEMKMYEENEKEETEELSNIELISPSEYFSRFPFNFELIQPFPKKVIECDEIPLNQVAELRSGANLFVEFKDI